MKKYLYETEEGRRKESHQKLGKLIQELPDGKRFQVIIKEIRHVHSISQMAYFHVVCSIYAIHTGHTMQEIKDEFKRARFFEMTIDKQGKEFKRLKETSGLDVVEYTSLINNLLQWGREEYPDVRVNRKEDMTYAQWLEYESAVENEYTKVFSGW